MIRLHVPQPLSAGAAVAPTLDQSRYLTQVMRLKTGDDLLVFNGQDGEWRCVVAEVLKKGVILKAQELVRPQTFGPDLDLIVAVVKKARVETIVEKAAELGVRRVRLTLTQRNYLVGRSNASGSRAPLPTIPWCCFQMKPLLLWTPPPLIPSWNCWWI